MQQRIEIQDEDKDRTYWLDVTYDWLGGEPELGIAATLEIVQVRCASITVWVDGFGFEAAPKFAAEHSRPEAAVGEWCLAKYRDEIEAALNDSICSLSEAA